MKTWCHLVFGSNCILDFLCIVNHELYWSFLFSSNDHLSYACFSTSLLGIAVIGCCSKINTCRIAFGNRKPKKKLLETYGVENIPETREEKEKPEVKLVDEVPIWQPNHSFSSIGSELLRQNSDNSYLKTRRLKLTFLRSPWISKSSLWFSKSRHTSRAGHGGRGSSTFCVREM